MAISVKSVTTAVVSGTATTSISLTTPSSPAAASGDLLVIFLSSDWSTLASYSMTSITPSATWTEVTGCEADGGTNSAHIKVWTAPVTTGGAVTVTADDGYGAGDEKYLAVWVISGADTASPVDASNTSSPTPPSLSNGTTIIAPTVSPSTSTALLLCHGQTDSNVPAGGNSYGVPTGMSNFFDVKDTAPFAQMVGASQVLSSSGATGTRTFTDGGSNGAANYVACSVAIKAGHTTPTVTTNAVTSVGPTSATGNGSVDSDGGDTITERGFVWSTSANPTTSDSKVTASGTTGSYNATLSPLNDNTLYHVRAYAINTNGTAYGADVTFVNLGATLAWIKA